MLRFFPKSEPRILSVIFPIPTFTKWKRFSGLGKSLVSSALLKMGIRGVTVSDVKGFGAQGGSKERQGGSEFYEDNFVAKVKMEIVVSKDQVEAIVDKIIEVVRTGEIGDGKIFLISVADAARVRAGERGERMSGGRADIFSVL